MKPVQNPTTFFFKQAENPPNPYADQIEEFVSKLFNKTTCLLCKNSYSLKSHLPRILIHCGHTFCTPCLANFYRNNRIRCPMCLKLIKHLDTLDRLPVNHTIFKDLVEKEILLCKSKGLKPQIQNADKYLFAEFERVQRQAHRLANPPQIDPHSGLPFCSLHPDRVEHFFCVTHQAPGCRICVEVGHIRQECKVIDLYEIDQPQQFMNDHQAHTQTTKDIINPNLIGAPRPLLGASLLDGLEDYDIDNE